MKKLNFTKNQINDLLEKIRNIWDEFTNAKGPYNTLSDRIDARSIKDRQHMKKIFLNLPLMVPNGYHNKILATGVSNYIYPQCFTMDKTNNEIFILYSADGGTTKRWIVVYDLNGNFKTCFGAGDAGGEGIVVKTEDTSRYLYVKTTDTKLGKFNITTLPQPMTILSPVSEFSIGLHYDFCYKRGKWLIEQANPALGYQKSRTNLSMYNDEFEMIGHININRGLTGVFTTDSEPYLPKRQGLDIGPNFIYQACGGYWDISDPITPYTYCGLQLLNKDGTLHMDNLYNPKKFASIIESNSSNICRRIENEGVYVDEENNVYSMYIIENRNNTTWDKQGIVVLEDFSNDDGAIDFSLACELIPQLNLLELERGPFPRNDDGKMYNPISGECFNTINQIIKFMQDTEMKKFQFYTSAATILDINNQALPAGYLATLENANNMTFILSLEGYNGIKKYCIYGSDMQEVNRKIKEITLAPKTIELELEGSIQHYYDGDKLTLTIMGNMVTINGMLKNIIGTPSDENSILIANIPEEYRPSFNRSFICPLTNAGPYGMVLVTVNGNIFLTYKSNVASECLNLTGVNYSI